MAQTKRLQSYGRRHGRKLRQSRQELLDDLLPKLRPVLPEDGSLLDAPALFERSVQDIWLEVGFGGGEHLAQQASDHPHIGLIGCEPFINGVASLITRIDAEGLANIRILDDDARLLFDALPEGSIGRIFVLFADPWPKKRHNNRRFINKRSLDDLARLLKDGAIVRFASDHMDYISWTLAHFMDHPNFEWTAEEPKDWRQRPKDWPETRYEAKAAQRGVPSVYLQFERLPR